MFYIRCQWMTAANRRVQGRRDEVSPLLLDKQIVGVMGSRWFGLGSSKKDALRRGFTANSLEQAWERERYVGESFMHQLSLWNGADGLMSAGLSVTLFEPADEPDTLVLNLPYIKLSKSTWNNICAIAKLLSMRLGGVALVGAGALFDMLEQRGVDWAEDGAYACYWGEDRSGKNPLYSSLLGAGHEPPYEFVACETAKSVESPSTEILRQLAELLSR